jgi:hypothetical protein
VRLRRTVGVPVTQDGWLVAVVTGDTPLDDVLPGTGARPFAFTNPIWVDFVEAEVEAPPPRPAPRRALPPPLPAPEGGARRADAAVGTPG